jgi:hypothetical protein
MNRRTAVTTILASAALVATPPQAGAANEPPAPVASDERASTARTAAAIVASLGTTMLDPHDRTEAAWRQLMREAAAIAETSTLVDFQMVMGDLRLT